MPGRLGPRFAIEGLFLIGLAVGAAYADLERKWIVLVMAGGWLVVALLELTADRIWAAAPPWRRPDYMAASPPRAEAVAPPAPPAAPPAPLPEPEPVAEAEPAPEAEPPAEPEPEPEPVPVPEPEPEAATIIARPVEPAAHVAEPDAEPERQGEAEEASVADELPRPTLEPLDPGPRRRWFRRLKRAEPVEPAPTPEPPKHVRLLPPAEQAAHTAGEVTEIFDTTEREERSRR
jgi:hypothetical protein